jgi:catechol 2,3-dioxygenase
MSSPWIHGLRSVALNVPDLARAEQFYTEVWRLVVVARSSDALYLRGTGADHHLLSLHQGETIAIRHVTLRARSEAALLAVAHATLAAGGRVQRSIAPIDEPGGGVGLTVRDPDGRLFQVLHGDARHADTAHHRDRPVRLAHAVLNSHDVGATMHFMEHALKFKLSDRTRIMAFMNCDRDHHTIALGDTDNDALNHIAFVMPDLDAVMRGGGRMRDAGFGIEWGPGRHGPGNNVFNYFIGPFGEVIEYTAEIEQIDERYGVRGPAEWAWPPGRSDAWGISHPPSAALKAAQRCIFFTPT